MSAPILEARGLKAFYGPSGMHGVDFEVDEGGVTALLGANGAGKTTTLRAISAMIRREGELSFRGAPLAARACEDVARLGVAHVPDGRGTFTDLTVDENLRLGAYTRRDRRGARRISTASSAIFRASPSGASSRRARCRAASSRCWRSRARCCCGRACCCSTSPRSASRR